MLPTVADVAAAGDGCAGCAEISIAKKQIGRQQRAMRSRAMNVVVLFMRESSIVTPKLIRACDSWLAGRSGSARGRLLE